MNDNQKVIISNRLFPTPSFWRGIARLFDFSGKGLQDINIDDSPEKADYNALQSDWNAIGFDFKVALQKYGKAK